MKHHSLHPKLERILRIAHSSVSDLKQDDDWIHYLSDDEFERYILGVNWKRIWRKKRKTKSLMENSNND